MKLINIGFGSMVAANRLLAIVAPDSAPIKRVIQEARDRGMLIDASFGRKTKAVILMDTDHVILSAIAPELQALAAETDELSGHYDGFQANICLNYGGRAEILRAAQRCAEAGEDWTEENFGKYLYSAGIPDPELIIRPSGELRLSNFLLWQCAYSEFYFCDTLWPDFTRAELDRAIVDYQGRDRRFGGVKA